MITNDNKSPINATANESRCFLLLKNVGSKPGIKFTCTLIEKGAGKYSVAVDGLLGQSALEFDYTILEDFCQVANSYIELKWFKELAFTFLSHKRPKLRRTDIKDDNGQKISREDLEKIQKLVHANSPTERLDDFLCDKDINLNINWGQFQFSLFKSKNQEGKKLVLTEPFTQITIPSTSVQITRNTGITTVSALGCTVTTNQPFSVTTYFLTVLFVFLHNYYQKLAPYFQDHSISQLLSKYREFYNKKLSIKGCEERIKQHKHTEKEKIRNSKEDVVRSKNEIVINESMDYKMNKDTTTKFNRPSTQTKNEMSEKKHVKEDLGKVRIIKKQKTCVIHNEMQDTRLFANAHGKAAKENYKNVIEVNEDYNI